MRKTIFALAVVAALASPAQAQVDRIEFEYPACVTLFHAEEADVLTQAHMPVNQDFCVSLPKGTEIVLVEEGSYSLYARIAYMLNGQPISLFIRKEAVASVNARMQAVNAEIAK